MAILLEQEPVVATESEQPILVQLNKVLVETPTKKARLIGPDGEEIELPDSVFQILKRLVYHLKSGKVVNIIATAKKMTTQDAADILNVSRPYLIKLLKDGEIPFEMVGSHRRIKFDDLMEYKKARDIHRKEALTKLAQLSQESEFDF